MIASSGGSLNPLRFIQPLERGALAQFVGGRVSASGDRAIAAALQVVGDGVGEDLRSSAVTLVDKIAADGVGIDGRGPVIVLYLEVSAHGISRAARGGANQRCGAAILQQQALTDAGSTDLIGAGATAGA